MIEALAITLAAFAASAGDVQQIVGTWRGTSTCVNRQLAPACNEFVYDRKAGCWRSEFTTPRAHGVWCLTNDGAKITGSLRVLPENAEVRKVELKRVTSDGSE